MVKTQRLSSPLDPIRGHHKQKYFHISPQFNIFEPGCIGTCGESSKAPPQRACPQVLDQPFLDKNTFLQFGYYLDKCILPLHFAMCLSPSGGSTSSCSIVIFSHFMVRRKSIKKHLGELAAVTKLGMAEDDFTNFHLHAAQSDLYWAKLPKSGK